MRKVVGWLASLILSRAAMVSALASVCVWVGQPVFGQLDPPPLVVAAPKKTAEPALDGVIANGEYAGVLHVSFDRELDDNPGRIQFHNNYDDTDEDMSFNMYTAHTDTALYLAFDVKDDFLDIQDEDAEQPWENDAVELFINADGDSEDMIPGTGRTSGAEGFQIIADAVGHQFFGNGGINLVDFQVGTKITGTNYVIEFRIPLNEIDTLDGDGARAAQTGDSMRFDVGLSDNDIEIDNNQDGYGELWRNEGEGSPFGVGEPGWHALLVLTAKQCDINGDGAADAADAGLMFGNWANVGTGDCSGDGVVDAADAGVLFGEWTGDPTAEPGTVAAEYNVTTGEIKVAINDVVNWYIESASGGLTGAAVPDLPGPGLVTDNNSRVGETALGKFSYNTSLGNVAATGLAAGDLTIYWNSALGQPLRNAPVPTVPEPTAGTMLLMASLCGLAFRRRFTV